MKKIRIITTVLLSFVAIFLLLGFVFHCRDANEYVKMIEICKKQFNTQDLTPFYRKLTIEIVSLLLFLFSFLAVVFSILVQYPKIFNRSAWEKHKADRAAARAAKAEADKQKQIAELEQKLDELKRDE